MRLSYTGVILAIAALGIAGIASAVNSTTASGVVHACVNTTTKTVRITAVCLAKEHAMSWNIRGVRGASGPTGPAGAVGAAGPQGPAGAQGSPGANGPAGATGLAGSAGPVGPEGPSNAYNRGVANANITVDNTGEFFSKTLALDPSTSYVFTSTVWLRSAAAASGDTVECGAEIFNSDGSPGAGAASAVLTLPGNSGMGSTSATSAATTTAAAGQVLKLYCVNASGTNFPTAIFGEMTAVKVGSLDRS
jgi:hypothetical protein